MRRFATLTAAAALVLSTSTNIVKADDNDLAGAVAGVVIAGILGAAVADHQHNEGHEDYRPHSRLHPDENAVGTCMHHGKRIVKKAGGHSLQLDTIDSIDAQGDSTVVVFEATGYYDFGSKSSVVRCTVRNHKVVSFDYS